MADLVADLLGMGLTLKDLGNRLELNPEEVDRLADRGNMLKRATKDGYNNGWTV